MKGEIETDENENEKYFGKGLGDRSRSGSRNWKCELNSFLLRLGVSKYRAAQSSETSPSKSTTEGVLPWKKIKKN